MSMNVFGTPIDNAFVEGQPDYRVGKTITRLDRAKLALQMKNSEKKDVDAQTYVDNLKKDYGNGASTKCLIYNATGDKVTYVLSHDWHGNIGASPYPTEIENGQWGAFLHEHPDGKSTGSSAAVVYHGLNDNDEGRDWCLAWLTPWSSVLNNNYCFAEVRQAGHYSEDNWNYINNLMEDTKYEHHDTWGGCVSKATTGSGTTVYFNGIMTLENA